MFTSRTFYRKELPLVNEIAEDEINHTDEESERPSKNDETSLKFVWLMSFPNSGTSYTITLAKDISTFTMATNYGKEVVDENGESVLVQNEFPDGPYRTSIHRPLPDHFILTKTHCDGFCVHCKPEEYIIDESKFLRKCTQGKKKVFEDSSKEKIITINTAYNISIVEKAIHLFRNPFDNIVSRYHLEHKRHKTDSKWLEEYPLDPIGFRKWCLSLDRKYGQDDFSYFSREVLDSVKDVPCYADFFRYIQWHNHAWFTIRKQQLPFLTVYYEDYNDHFNVTVSRILDFLDLERSGKPKEFHSSNYFDHFTSVERETAVAFMKNFSTSETWQSISRYMDY